MSKGGVPLERVSVRIERDREEGRGREREEERGGARGEVIV